MRINNKFLYGIILLLLLFVSKNVFTQTLSEQDKSIRAEIPASLLPKLHTAEDYLSRVESNLKEITENDKQIYHLKEENQSVNVRKQKKYNEKKIKELENESTELLKESSQLYYLSYKLILSVYKQKLQTYYTSDRNKRLKAGYYIKVAEQNRTQINIINMQVQNKKELKLIKTEFNEINLLRVQGIDKLKEAFCLYIECFKIKKNHSYKNSENSNSSYKEKVVTINDEVVFKVQILASKYRKNLAKLKIKYNINSPIEEYFATEFELYRYLTGNFADYYDAKDYAENTGIGDAFVVGFINGKRSKIEKAIELSLLRKQ